MVGRALLCSLSVIVVGATAALFAAESGASPEPITFARVRTFVRQAEAEAKGDGSHLVLGLDRRVRATWGDFESFPVSLLRSESILVTLTTPYMRYRRMLADYLKIGRKVPEVRWRDAAIVLVSPERIDSPDVVAVTIERDGRDVAPIGNTLSPMTFQSGNGQTAVLHAGEVSFPVAALRPGSTVAVSVRPATGTSIVYTLDESQLRLLK